MEDPEIVNVLFRYYDPKDHRAFYTEFLDLLFVTGNIVEFKKYLPYINVDIEDFGMAIENNQYELADFIRELLVVRGSDPLAHQPAVDELVVEGILDGKKELLTYLIDRGVTFDINKPFIKNNLDYADPEMIKYLNDLLNTTGE